MQICLHHAIFHIENYTNQTCKHTYKMAIMSEDIQQLEQISLSLYSLCHPSCAFSGDSSCLSHKKALRADVFSVQVAQRLNITWFVV